MDNLFKRIQPHEGHPLRCFSYSDYNVIVECTVCKEVLVNAVREVSFSCSNKNTAGTSLFGYFETSFEKLKKALGEPNRKASWDGKSSTEWGLQSDMGDVVVIYDYKETSLYKEENPSVEEFRAKPSYKWHIGAKDENTAKELIQWLEGLIEP